MYLIINLNHLNGFIQYLPFCNSKTLAIDEKFQNILHTEITHLSGFNYPIESLRAR